MSDWDLMRSHMPVLKKWVYFDHAAVSPLSIDSREEMAGWLQQAVEEGDTVWRQWNDRVDRLRATGARLLGADVDEIAIVPNTTAGLGIVAEGIDWRQGENVVTLADEFPSNLYPWLNLRSRGVETRMVEAECVDDPRVILDACDSQTRLISISWVSYITGWQMHLEELVESAHARNILVMVDGIQGFGVLPMDVRAVPIDFLAADGHKWLMGPEGVGFLFVRRDRLDQLRPLGVGWNSVEHRYDYSKIEMRLRPQAARYEGGSHNMVGIAGLDASTRFLEAFGYAKDSSVFADRMTQTTRHAIEELKRIGAEIKTTEADDHRAGIVTFRFDSSSSNQLRKKCSDAGIVISCRNGWLRASPHVYNSTSDIDQLVESLR